MEFEFTRYFGILFITAMVSAIVAYVAWQRRATRGAQPLALMMLAVAEWSLASALEAV